MATASLSFQITATVDDQPVAFPQTGVSAPTQITYTSNLTMLKYEQVAASGAVLKTLFDPTEEMFAAGGSAGDFDLMVILSDQDIWLEIRGTGADDNSAIHVKANVPFILGSVSTRDYNAAGDFAGTILPMTAIKAKNLGATVANVWVFAVT